MKRRSSIIIRQDAISLVGRIVVHGIEDRFVMLLLKPYKSDKIVFVIHTFTYHYNKSGIMSESLLMKLNNIRSVEEE